MTLLVYRKKCTNHQYITINNLFTFYWQKRVYKFSINMTRNDK